MRPGPAVRACPTSPLDSNRGSAMLLTRKSDHVGVSSSSLVHSLSRGVSRAIPTLDRRGFLRRSGLGLGAGMAVSQLVLVRKAKAADVKKHGGDPNAKVEV